MTVRLGCIADDFTGATDLANNLVRAGMRAVQTIGVPRDGAAVDADAVVVALKSRTIAPEQKSAAIASEMNRFIVPVPLMTCLGPNSPSP